jgi:hypothetical protein
MRTVSKSLLTLSICLGLSGAVYAQATPSNNVDKPAAAHATHALKGKEKPAAVSGETKKAEPGAVKESKSSSLAKPETAKKPEPAKKVEKPAKASHVK